MVKPCYSLVFILVCLAALFPTIVESRGGGGCFLPDTLIEMADGKSHMISSLKPGDRVKSYSIEKGVQESTVIACHSYQTEEYYSLSTEQGELHVTRDHLFACPNRIFRTAWALATGVSVLVSTDSELKPAKIIEIRVVKTSTTVHNILTGWPQSYFADSHLVHNKGCFVPETLIELVDGNRIPIRDVKPGQRVRAFTLQGALVAAEVERVFSLEVDGCFEIVTKSGFAIKATAEHPFYIGSGTFRAVESLVPGDQVIVFRSGLEPDIVQRITRLQGKFKVYNLQTDQPNTFIAGGIAVHNKGGGCFAAGTAISLPDGKIAPIETLKPGQTILSGNGKPVTVKLTASSLDELIRVETAKRVLYTTKEHPFLLQRGQYGQVREFGRLSFIRTFGGALERVVRIIPTGAIAPVYEIAVDEPHTYFAGGVQVHNKGGFGGGSHGFHGGGGGVVDWVVELIFYFLIILLPAIFSSPKKSGSSNSIDEFVSLALVEKKAQQTTKLIEAIGASDAQFQVEALQDVARMAFLTLQDVWQSRDYTPMRSMVFPDLWKNHENQIKSMIRNHEINVIEQVTIEHLHPVWIFYTKDPNHRQVTFIIQATAKDYYINESTKRILRGDSKPERFQEFWTFQYLQEKYLLREIEQAGEASALYESNRVETLPLSVLNSLTSGMEQPVANPKGKVQTLVQKYSQHDLTWNEKEMKEQARSSALSLYMALEKGEPGDLCDYSDKAFIQGLEQTLKSGKELGIRQEFRNICVRRVDITMARKGGGGKPDEFVARISMHAKRLSMRGSTVLREDQDVVKFETLLHFSRNNGQFLLDQIMSRGDSSDVQI
ncbi:MAG: TIM44-like domain-containing protein [Candidatus Riflebacteria bacterium]|nr:TIM44-like domain-containing protein [Candidatus Riflebacteria bacterium]